MAGTEDSRVVDVVIVAHDSGDLLLDAAHSASAEAGPAHVWVVDAESSDGSVEKVAAGLPEAHIVRVPNAGFSAGNNRGIEASSAPFVLLLNPDAELAPGALRVLLQAMAEEPKAGIVAPVVLSPNGEVQAGSYGRFPSVSVRLQQTLGRLGRKLTRTAEVPVRPARRMAVDWVTGAAMLVRREAIEAVGPMDEKFFLYYEDIEWCHRMWDGGWQVLVEPGATAVHHVGQSGGGLAERAYRESFERYCDLYGLHVLKATARLAVGVRRMFGGRQ